MTSIILLIALVAGFGTLVRYARHDRFAGPTVRTCRRDGLGRCVPARLVS